MKFIRLMLLLSAFGFAVPTQPNVGKVLTCVGALGFGAMTYYIQSLDHQKKQQLQQKANGFLEEFQDFSDSVEATSSALNNCLPDYNFGNDNLNLTWAESVRNWWNGNGNPHWARRAYTATADIAEELGVHNGNNNNNRAHARNAAQPHAPYTTRNGYVLTPQNTIGGNNTQRTRFQSRPGLTRNTAQAHPRVQQANNGGPRTYRQAFSRLMRNNNVRNAVVTPILEQIGWYDLVTYGNQYTRTCKEGLTVAENLAGAARNLAGIAQQWIVPLITEDMDTLLTGDDN